MKTLFILIGLSLGLSAFAVETRHRQFNSYREIYDYFKKHPEIRGKDITPSTEERAYYGYDGSVKRTETVPVLILTYEE